MNDLPLFRARASDPITSHLAAERAESFAGQHHRKIVDWLMSNPGGGIKDEIALGTGIDHIAVARRMKELERENKVARSAETRPTRTGRQAQVWVLA